MARAKGLERAAVLRDAPSRAVNGEHLQVCSADYTCCTAEMEEHLRMESRDEYQQALQDRMVALQRDLETQKSRVDRFMTDLLAKARRELHSMFLQTYGSFYTRHSEVFAELFKQLAAFYATGETDLSAALDHFYEQLYRRMFSIMNAQLTFDDAYWQCMQPLIGKLKPFGDVPFKMKQQLERSVQAARTFVQALDTATSVVRSLVELAPSEACETAAMRMMYCGHCAGAPSLRPCRAFCLRVVEGCVAPLASLDHDWNLFVDALMQLLDRLTGPFNVESVINPIDVHISEAVMIFQERGAELSTRVFEGCGPLSESRRRRRRAASMRGADKGVQRLNGGSIDGLQRGSQTSELDVLAADLKAKIGPSRSFWRDLPAAFCNHSGMSASSAEETNCWNGGSTGRHLSSGVTDSSSATVTNQAIKLRLATSQLRVAYKGQRIDWHSNDKASDVAETIEEFSGSGDVSSELEDGRRPAETDDEDLLAGVEGSGVGDVEVEGSGAPAERPVVVPWRGSHREHDYEPSTTTTQSAGIPDWRRPQLSTVRLPPSAAPSTTPPPAAAAAVSAILPGGSASFVTLQCLFTFAIAILFSRMFS